MGWALAASVGTRPTALASAMRVAATATAATATVGMRCRSTRDYRVVGGLMSPCHDTHVRVKCRVTPNQMLPRRHRLQLCREAVKHSSWIAVDRWDITRRRVMDYLAVLEHAQEICEKQFVGREFRLVYICSGSQLLTLSPRAMRDKGFACIAICRPGETNKLMRQVPTPCQPHSSSTMCC